jgi:Tfp pilus assembly protein PilE
LQLPLIEVTVAVSVVATLAVALTHSHQSYYCSLFRGDTFSGVNKKSSILRVHFFGGDNYGDAKHAD